MLRFAAVALSCLALALANPATTAAAEKPKAPNDSPARLTSFDELQRRLDDQDLRLLDVRAKDDYDAAHVPGASWVDVKAAEKIAGRPGGLADRPAWEDFVAGLGLKPGIDVVIHDDGRQLDAARLWWLLSYLGVDKVGLLDGGFPLWKKQGRPVTADAPAIAPTGFSVVFRPERLATRADVLANLDSRTAQIVDARSDAEFSGAKKLADRGGRLPGARHLEWSEFVDKDGRFLPPETLRAKLKAAGLEKADAPIITHCQSGGRSSVSAFVIERLGHPTRNYYLGWSDWGNAQDLPVETDAAEPR